MKDISASYRIARLRIRFEWKSEDNLWGRFGGGWNWKLGVQWGSRSLIFSLLVCSLRLDWCEDSTKNG